MKHFNTWLQETGRHNDGRPWLVFGKGPSFAKRHQFDPDPFHTLSLNHAVREQPVTVAHMVDLDAFTACADVIEQQAQVVVLPWHPHVDHKPGEKTLAQWAEEIPALKRLDEAGRLLWYDLSTGKRRHGDFPVIKVRWFSVEAALNLLAQAGIRQVRSLGVDGGTRYSNEFADLNDVTRLANGHPSFDRQFAEIAKILLKTGLDYAPLDEEAPVRVYVGSTEPQWLATRVLEHSIKRHASMSVQVFPLYQSGIPIPQPRDPQNRPRTPFSFQRFVIPQWAGFTGRAIYVDSDMQVFRDIRALWDLPFNGAQVLAVGDPMDDLRRPQFSVMLLDCANLPWHVDTIVARLDEGELTYEQTVYEMRVADRIRADVPPEWNCLERYDSETSALVHYTDMTKQPWLSRRNPLCALWVQGLLDAIDDGFITIDEVADDVAKGYSRPSLLFQARHRIVDPANLPAHARWLDADFVPPHLLAKTPRNGVQTARHQLCRQLAKVL